jgi:hypothetical protein
VGDRINYPGEVVTPTAEMLVAKLLFNSVISTKGAQFITINISDFYLMTSLHRAKIVRIKLRDVPNGVINTSSERNPPKMEASTSEPSVECTASHKQDY